MTTHWQVARYVLILNAFSIAHTCSAKMHSIAILYAMHGLDKLVLETFITLKIVMVKQYYYVHYLLGTLYVKYFSYT